MTKRAGVTEKVSLSVHRSDLQFLRRRAEREFDGNLSAVFNDLIATLRREEAMDDLIRRYGPPTEASAEELERIDAELLGRTKRPKRQAKSRRTKAA